MGLSEPDVFGVNNNYSIFNFPCVFKVIGVIFPVCELCASEAGFG